MKKQLLLFLLAVITALSGYAADFQLEATTTGYRINGGSVVSFSGSIAGKSFNDAEITVSFAKGSGGSNPQINSSGYFQLYAGNTMTITRANSEKLSSANIVVAGTNYNLSNCTASNGTPVQSGRTQTPQPSPSPLKAANRFVSANSPLNIPAAPAADY
ncbi:MAG: hypothetical protein ACI30N_03765 [Muribaculaceae bacterium]